MDAEEPDLVLDAIEGRVPFDRLAHAGDGTRDERIEAASDVAFPARHGGDIGLHVGVAISLRYFCGFPPERRAGFAATRLAASFFAIIADFFFNVLPLALRHFATHGSTNMYRPVRRSDNSGSCGE